jgi:hypothetical protein
VDAPGRDGGREENNTKWGNYSALTPDPSPTLRERGVFREKSAGVALPSPATWKRGVFREKSAGVALPSPATWKRGRG